MTINNDNKLNARRRFLGSMGAIISAAAVGSRVIGSPAASRNLVPATPSKVPNYWCTWAAQNYLYGQGATELEVSTLEGADGAAFARGLLNQKILLGDHGWAKTFHHRIRDELYLLLDDGWEEGGTATFQLDRKKFPTFTGSAEQRLKALNKAVRADGWRALALWCRNTPAGVGAEQCVSWSKFADVNYLKIDRGDQNGSFARARSDQKAAITLEHVYANECLNGEWLYDGRFGVQPWGSPRLQVLRETDIYRTYDATAVLGVPTTLDRVAELLKGASGHPEVQALLNVEDEVYIAAVLGCSMGVMRHPMRGLRPGTDPDLFFPPPRQLKQRMDEVVRAVRWQRIAPPYSAGKGSIVLDAEILTDEWVFGRDDTFDPDVAGKRARQGAPARLARNMELPVVSCEGEAPYVLCNRFPGGAAAIGALERVSVERQAYQPLARVRWMLDDASGPFGIFGQFGSLTLVFERPLRPGRILAQDLAADVSIDITDDVRINRSEITIPGELINRVGRLSATINDDSMPGLVLTI